MNHYLNLPSCIFFPSENNIFLFWNCTQNTNSKSKEISVAKTSTWQGCEIISSCTKPNCNNNQRFERTNGKATYSSKSKIGTCLLIITAAMTVVQSTFVWRESLSDCTSTQFVALESTPHCHLKKKFSSLA